MNASLHAQQVHFTSMSYPTIRYMLRGPTIVDLPMYTPEKTDQAYGPNLI